MHDWPLVAYEKLTIAVEMPVYFHAYTRYIGQSDTSVYQYAMRHPYSKFICYKQPALN